MSSFLTGRTIMVTAATSGIGYETARLLAECGATVLLHGRTPDEARAAVRRLLATADVDAEALRPCAADFSKLDEVERLANRVIASHPYLDGLVNNAAVAAPERHTVTADGNELSFQVNFLAHYLLTHLLEPALTTDPGGRVVNVTSSVHRTASITWNDPNRTRHYSSLAAYAQSRLALTVFAADPRVTAVSVDPGICETALRPLYGPGGVTPAEGAAYVARLCDPAFEIVNGAYYDRGERMEPATGATADRTVKRLNKLADQLVGHSA